MLSGASGGNVRLFTESKFILSDPSVLAFTIEQLAELRSGARIYVEKQLENQRWPSDEKEIRRNLEKNRVTLLRTTGCINLGNTCYMNSVLQCVSNSPFFKEFFCPDVPNPAVHVKEKPYHDYRKHLNTMNPISYNGEVAK